MDRLTTEKPVKEMTMTELSLNGCYIDKTGWARYRDYDTDIDARDFVRKLLERYEPEQPIPEESGDLEQLLFDELQYGALDHAGSLVALVYMMIVSMAELRAHLAAYEDTGLEPEEITEYLNATDEYVKASEEGRLIVLPCKVWDTVYEPTNRGTISTYLVSGFRIEPFDSIWLEWDIQTGFVYRNIDGVNADAIGKTVFLTREEAEAALGGDGE